MNADAASVALNLLAFIGAGAYVFGQWSARERTPVDVRLAALFALLMLLVGVRAARWGFDLEALRHAEEALAAFLPLFALVLAEGLLRRHAPGRLKITLVVFAFVFAIAALLRPDASASAFAVVLGAYVAASLGVVALLLGLRNHRSLSPGENAAISALFTGLVIALPLAATDFLAAAGFVPIRAGGLAVIIVVFAAARVTAEGGGGWGVLTELLWSIAAAALAFAVLTFVMGWPSDLEAVRLFALVLAVTLVFRIVEYVRAQRAARRRSSLWSAFAEAPGDNLDAFLGRVLAAPELARAHLLEGATLVDYDADALRRAFDASPVISAAEARQHFSGANEQLGVIFDVHEATHAVLIDATPLRLLLVNLPRVGAGPDAHLQLRVLAKLAAEVGDHA